MVEYTWFMFVIVVIFIIFLNFAIIPLHTEGDIFVLCQASKVWIEYTISLIQIQFYRAACYGVLHRITPATLLQLNIQLKIQLKMARFEPRTFQVHV